VDIPELYLSTNSFINLLFDDSFSSLTYEYRYKEETNKLIWPRIVLQRIQVYPASSKYLVLSNTGNNVFNLQQDDLVLLDALLAFRLDSTSVTIVENSQPAFFDSTSNILYVDFSLLSTPLSKLIFLYLDLKINENFTRYNNLLLVSSGGLLESCFEAYVIDEYFKFITNREPNLIYTPPYGGPGSC
jgi:hypothetical protein